MKSKVFKKSDCIMIAALILLMFLFLYHGIDIDYKIEDENIKINWFTGVSIPFKDIESVKMLDSTPNMIKIMGMDFMNIRQGIYSLEGIGRVKMYARDIRRKMVLVKTSKMTYALTPKDPIQFTKLLLEHNE
ncbi:MAG TPA: hypothetical protein DD429_06190 [Clostridiaceae bacterium]|nr:hypothetical protein [Clostridiaceae bacterium]